jgi:hypothetical protein
MSVLDDLLKKAQQVKVGLQSDLVRGVLMGHTEDILDCQREQLLQGKASSGEDIRPFYSEDLKPSGYFSSSEAAGRYSAWKETLTYPSYKGGRNPDAPNLFITGKFHDELGVFYDSDSVAITGATGYANRIIQKYGISTFGLMQEYWNDVFYEKGALGELINNIRQVFNE